MKSNLVFLIGNGNDTELYSSKVTLSLPQFTQVTCDFNCAKHRSTRELQKSHIPIYQMHLLKEIRFRTYLSLRRRYLLQDSEAIKLSLRPLLSIFVTCGFSPTLFKSSYKYEPIS